MAMDTERGSISAGKCFLSYRRSAAAETGLLRAALHDIGVPTWQDVRDLGPGKAIRELREQLASSEVTSAVLLVTPEVRKSEAILRLEAPLILDRAARSADFFVQIVAAGGLDFDGAGDVLRKASTLEDVGAFNIYLVTGELDDAQAREIAALVLRERVRRLHRTLPGGAAIQLGLFAADPVQPRRGTGLVLDWRHRFEGREARPGAWESHLLPALETVATTVGREAPGRQVEAHGLNPLPAALALGVAFLEPRRLSLGWWQHPVDQLWTLTAPRESSGFHCEIIEQDLASHDLAVAISITDNALLGLMNSKKKLPSFRARIEVGKGEEYPYRLETPGQAVDVARAALEALRRARSRLGTDFHTVHIFLAGPAGVAVLLGQLLNTCERVQTWELAGDPKRYRAAALLRPNR